MRAGMWTAATRHHLPLIAGALLRRDDCAGEPAKAVCSRRVWDSPVRAHKVTGYKPGRWGPRPASGCVKGSGRLRKQCLALPTALCIPAWSAASGRSRWFVTGWQARSHTGPSVDREQRQPFAHRGTEMTGTGDSAGQGVASQRTVRLPQTASGASPARS